MNTEFLQEVSGFINGLERDTVLFIEAHHLRLCALEQKYSPDQPRDYHGRWTGDGGDSDAVSGGSGDDHFSGGSSGDRIAPPSSATPTPENTHPHSTPSGTSYNNKIHRQMPKRGWTPDQIDEAVTHGPRIDAINKATGGPATRYQNPTTGQYVIIDNTTNRILQVGDPNFKFGVESGDVPGAQFRPAPSQIPQGGGGGGAGKPEDIFHLDPYLRDPLE